MYYNLTARCILDFVAACEASFVSWEIITLFETYGMKLFACLVYANILQRSYRYKISAGVSCPYTHLQTYVAARINKPVTQYRMPEKELIIRVLTQTIGGLFGYRIVRTVWNFNFTPVHAYRSYYTSYGQCWTFLHVETHIGFLLGF